jgi:hypothetical protein
MSHRTSGKKANTDDPLTYFAISREKSSRLAHLHFVDTPSLTYSSSVNGSPRSRSTKCHCSIRRLPASEFPFPSVGRPLSNPDNLSSTDDEIRRDRCTFPLRSSLSDSHSLAPLYTEYESESETLELMCYNLLTCLRGT